MGKIQNVQEKGEKTFNITCANGFDDLRTALLRRGWVESKDPRIFDLKWSLKCKDLNHSKLRPHQIVNHFEQSQSVTTKSGLIHSLHSLRWFEDVNPESFFPRSYDLSSPGEVEAFENDF
ncbi:hypothetical protein CYMTET_24730, partial [Cymbomonas tetramitiformis]